MKTFKRGLLIELPDTPEIRELIKRLGGKTLDSSIPLTNAKPIDWGKIDIPRFNPLKNKEQPK